MEQRPAIPSAPASPAQRVMEALGVLAALMAGVTTALGYGTVVAWLLLVVCLYYAIGVRWQRGIYGLLLYVPFAGMISLALAPSRAPLLFKDVLFVLPAYLSFFACLILGRESLRGLPTLPVALMLVLGSLATLQLFNPGVVNPLMGLIGLKVWLFYLPLFALGFALVTTEREFFVLLRVLVSLAFLPCLVGLTQVFLVQTYGYQPVMETLYGSNNAERVTQNWAQFQVGEGLLVRIPSVFSFATQYLGYTFGMLGPCYALWRGDPSIGWRRIGGGMLLLVIVASFLSGSRGAFVFIPLLLVLTFGFDHGFSGLIRGGTYTLGLIVTALAFIGVGSIAMYELVSELFFRYTQQIVYESLLQAITIAPLGTGTGTNTGAARYALADPDTFIVFESYYAKAVYELGLPGLVVVAGLFFSFLILGYRVHQRLQRPSLRCCSAGFLAFVTVMILNNFKGWMLDLDPLNVYFWLFMGILMKLPALVGTADTEEIQNGSR